MSLVRAGVRAVARTAPQGSVSPRGASIASDKSLKPESFPRGGHNLFLPDAHDMSCCRPFIIDQFQHAPREFSSVKDVWVDVALGKEDDARKTIGEVSIKHPFEIRYDKIEPVHWEQCSKVLDSAERKRCLMKGWERK